LVFFGFFRLHGLQGLFRLRRLRLGHRFCGFFGLLRLRFWHRFYGFLGLFRLWLRHRFRFRLRLRFRLWSRNLLLRCSGPDRCRLRLGLRRQGAGRPAGGLGARDEGVHFHLGAALVCQKAGEDIDGNTGLHMFWNRELFCRLFWGALFVILGFGAHQLPRSLHKLEPYLSGEEAGPGIFFGLFRCPEQNPDQEFRRVAHGPMAAAIP
jgi:hypothetical protein